MGDQGSTKSLRTFQCRDYLYEVFDRLSSEHECSVDYLINEAMREYARARSQQVANVVGSSVASPAAPGYAQGAEPSIPVDVHRPDMQLVPSPQIDLPGADVPPTLSDRPGLDDSDQFGLPDANAKLTLLFNTDVIPIEKEEFIIGRGSRTADLAIRDGNISRRHAAVVLHGGVHYIKDLGSTNGIEFAGRRVESKRIEEGDVYRICDYELRFTYQ